MRIRSRLQRRRRVAVPKRVLVFGLIFILLPAANYIATCIRLKLDFAEWRGVLYALTWIEIILMIAPIAIGIGLLRVQKWGWQLLMLYAFLLTAHNMHRFIKRPVGRNTDALINSVIGLATAFYFLRRDISAPYMRMYPRGWRLQNRKPIQMIIRINGLSYLTRDVSLGGVYVSWSDCPLNINEQVVLEIPVSGETFTLSGGIVRIDEDGAGVAFREASDRFTEALSMQWRDPG